MAGNDCEDNDIGDGFNECLGSEQTVPFKLKVPSKAIDPSAWNCQNGQTDPKSPCAVTSKDHNKNNV